MVKNENNSNISVMGDKNPVNAVRELIEMSKGEMSDEDILEAVSRIKAPAEMSDEIIALLDEYEIISKDPTELEQELETELSRYDSKALFMQYCPNPKKLTEQNEIDLAKRVEEGDKDAVKEMVEANLKLVISIARKYNANTMTQDDLIQEGALGLITAVEKYDWRKGVRFGTHATWWIRQAILRAISNQDRIIRLPVHMCESISKLTKSQKKLREILQREPTAEELAKDLKLSVKVVQERMRYSFDTLYLDTPISDDEGKEANLAHYIEDNHFEPAQVIVERKDLSARILEMVDTLPAREGKVIRMRYGIGEYTHPLTLEDAAVILGVTKERVRQIENRATRRLGEEPRKSMLYGYVDNEYVDDPYKFA